MRMWDSSRRSGTKILLRVAIPLQYLHPCPNQHQLLVLTILVHYLVPPLTFPFVLPGALACLDPSSESTSITCHFSSNFFIFSPTASTSSRDAAAWVLASFGVCNADASHFFSQSLGTLCLFYCGMLWTLNCEIGLLRSLSLLLYLYYTMNILQTQPLSSRSHLAA